VDGGEQECRFQSGEVERLECWCDRDGVAARTATLLQLVLSCVLYTLATQHFDRSGHIIWLQLVIFWFTRSIDPDRQQINTMLHRPWPCTMHHGS
jgi:hypothetical protein